MMMDVNDTCDPGNSTGPCLAPRSPAGLAVGLTLFFMLLVIIAAVVIYKCSSEIRAVVPFGQRTSQKKDCAETGQADSEHYTSLMREQPTAQTPIYENLTAVKAGYNRPAAKQHRLPAEPEEDLYLQCDSVDEGIYTNDPAHNSILSDSREEDVYIVPDA